MKILQNQHQSAVQFCASIHQRPRTHVPGFSHAAPAALRLRGTPHHSMQQAMAAPRAGAEARSDEIEKKRHRAAEKLDLDDTLLFAVVGFRHLILGAACAATGLYGAYLVGSGIARVLE